MANIWGRKPIAVLQAEAKEGEFGSVPGEPRLRRTLSLASLIALGIGCIIGAGIFVLTGNAAAAHAGPAVSLSFILAGLVSTFAGLCYAEMASTVPVTGSAYTKRFHQLDGWIVRRLWSHRAKRWRNTCWKDYPTKRLLSEFKLVNFVSLIPSLRISPRHLCEPARCGSGGRILVSDCSSVD